MLKILLTTSMLCLCAVFAFADEITLTDGRYIQVKCLEANERGVRVHLLESGGEVWIPWVLIREADRKALRVRFSLESDDSNLVSAEEGVRLVTKDGDEHLGVPTAPLDLQNLPDEVILIVGGKSTSFKKSVIRLIEVAEVPALAAFTPEQLYQRKVKDGAPGADDVQGHWDLARFCIAIEAPEAAIRHLLALKQADAEFQTEAVARELARMEELARNARVVKAIRDAKQEAFFNRFPRSLQMLDEIVALVDITPMLKSQAEMTKEFVLKKRWEHYRTLVRRDYFTFLDQRIGKMARDEKLTLKDAQKEVRSTLHKDIVSDLAAKHGLDAKTEVQKMWEERVVHSPLSACYGSGSFIVLGRAPGAQEREQALQQALARMMAQQQQQSRGGQASNTAMPKFPKPPTADEWWTKLSDSGSRADWMKAYYAENGRQLKIAGERKIDCDRCGATGTIKYGGAQGELIPVTCPRCQGHKTDKGVLFK
ncbi:MAG: hypothetical protein EXS14_05465 [Planctomycetes bacterium]|nr:hypothetical protein [Planctomycetota bacterium]